MADIKTLLGDEYREDMTDAEIVAAVQKLTLPDMTQFVPKTDYDKLKTASDNNASEAKGWKDKYNSTLSEAQRQQQAAEEEQQSVRQRLAELERKEKISNTKDEYIKAGFNAKLALETAEAFVDGKMDVVLANITKHATDVAKDKTDKDLHDTPYPPAGGSANPGTINYDKEIADAMAAGDVTKAAYYERLKTEKK